MKRTLVFILLFHLNIGFSQNIIELTPSDCNGKNGFPAFLLTKAKPRILTEQKFGQIEKYEVHDLRIINNNSDTLKIQYTNIFGQIIDTTFYNAKQLTKIEICGNQFKDYEKESLIKYSIASKNDWVLISSWGHWKIENDKLIFKVKNGFLKFEYYKNGERIKSGEIKITEPVIKKITMFERKLNLMKNAGNGCNYGHSYKLFNGRETIEFQDNSCSGFSNEQLLNELKITE